MPCKPYNLPITQANPMPKACFHTLGCRLNQTESSLMAHALMQAGYEIVELHEGADLCVINTCTVTGQSDQKSRQSIRAIQRANPSALIAVVGCMSQLAGEEVAELGGVDLVLGNQEKLNIANYLPQVLAGGEPVIQVGEISRADFTIAGAGQHLLGQTRANLKMQDGCDFHCSFCIIPQARGRSRSRELGDALAELEGLLRRGVQEVVLTGVNLGTYQNGAHGFLDLCDAFSQAGLPRLRISSIEPTTLGPEVFGRMADTGHALLPYLHLPLQAANDEVLTAMRRHYTFADYARFVSQAAAAVPNLGLGSDLLTAFPGEGEPQFEEGYNRVASLPLQYIHVFPFARREGARAANLPHQVPPAEAAKRAERLRLLSDQKRAAFAQSQIGKQVKVLFEDNGKGGLWQGYAENYLRVHVNSNANLQGQIKGVNLTAAQGHRGLGELV